MFLQKLKYLLLHDTQDNNETIAIYSVFNGFILFLATLSFIITDFKMSYNVFIMFYVILMFRIFLLGGLAIIHNDHSTKMNILFKIVKIIDIFVGFYTMYLYNDVIIHDFGDFSLNSFNQAIQKTPYLLLYLIISTIICYFLKHSESISLKIKNYRYFSRYNLFYLVFNDVWLKSSPSSDLLIKINKVDTNLLEENIEITKTSILFNNAIKDIDTLDLTKNEKRKLKGKVISNLGYKLIDMVDKDISILLNKNKKERKKLLQDRKNHYHEIENDFLSKLEYREEIMFNKENF